MENNLSGKILARIYGKGRGYVFTPKDFLDLANHATVRQSLARFVEAGTIRRLLRGVYDYPAFSDFLKAPARPDPDAIARTIARAHGWTLLPAGETALNLLGLSTQVPAQWHYFSDGPSKRYEWSGGTIIFTRRANREIAGLSPKTVLVVQALKSLGKDRVDIEVMERLRRKLDRKERSRAVEEARYVTAWVYEVIKRLEEEEGHA
ncbi:MAG TPA: DUF6088 family protein [bacterium]|nr:DUF6088 family protein [bacterium]